MWNREKTRKFQARLMRWYHRHRRDLPWRDHPSPYNVWIAEVMLQQTQVKTALAYFERFLSRFPTVQTLAEAPESEVLAQWTGLGYYSRARNLHRAAKIIVEKFAGRFPDRQSDAEMLPGIGRYTAGAILSIALNQPSPVVDGNVKRVIKRLHAILNRVPEQFYWEQAKAWMPQKRPGIFNQAVMELGSLVCTPANPSCDICPVSLTCAARRKGLQHKIPGKGVRRAQENVELAMLVAKQGDAILLSREHPVDYIPGEWGLPTRSLRRGESAERLAKLMVREATGRKGMPQPCGQVRHGITHRRIRCHVFLVAGSPSSSILRNPTDCLWVNRHELHRYLTSSLFLKAIRSALRPTAH